MPVARNAGSLAVAFWMLLVMWGSSDAPVDRRNCASLSAILDGAYFYAVSPP